MIDSLEVAEEVDEYERFIDGFKKKIILPKVKGVPRRQREERNKYNIRGKFENTRNH